MGTLEPDRLLQFPRKSEENGGFEEMKRRCNPMACQQQQSPTDQSLINCVRRMPVGKDEWEVTSKQTKKLPFLSGAICLKPSKRNNSCIGKSPLATAASKAALGKQQNKAFHSSSMLLLKII